MSLARFTARLRDDSGSVPTFIFFLTAYMFVELMLIGGRTAAASMDANAAAREGARAGSLALRASDAEGLADNKARTFLINRGAQCPLLGTSMSGNTSNFRAGGTYEYEVTCRVNLSDVTLVPFWPVVTITKSALEPIETFRVVE